MKRAVLLIITILLMFSVIESEAFVHNRYQWWKVRLQKLQTQRVQLKKDRNIHKSVFTLLDNEIDRANAVISIFEQNIQNDGSLTSVDRKITDNVIKKEINSIVEPVFSVYYLATLVNESGNWNNIVSTKEIVAQHLDHIIEKRFQKDGEFLAQMIIDEDINNNEWRSLSAEIFIGKLMNSRNEVLKHIRKNVETRLHSYLGSRKYITNRVNLRKKITDIAMEVLEEDEMKVHLKHDKKSLVNAWSWKRISARINKNFDNYERILSFFGDDNSIHFQKLRYYRQYPLTLESVVFTRRNPHHINRKMYNSVQPEKRNNSIILQIPRSPNCRAMIKELDEMRKKAIISIDGKEKGIYFGDLRKHANSIISRYLGSANRIFKNSERILKENREKTEKQDDKSDEDVEEIEIKNLDEFKRARRAYGAQASYAYQYRKKSIDFLRWLSDSMKINSKQKQAEFDYMLKQMNRYSVFTKGLVEDSVDVYAINNPVVQKRYTLSVQRTSNIFKFIRFSISIGKDIKTSLSRRQVLTLRQDQHNFLKKLKLANHEIRKNYSTYARKKAAKAKIWQETSAALKETIAQYEIESLRKSAEEHIRLLQNRNYSESIFSQYTAVYNRNQDDARAGRLTSSLKSAIERGSLLDNIRNYNKREMNSELLTSAFLRRESRIAISKLITIITFYKRKRVNIKDYPRIDEISNLRRKINHGPEVRIASWRMNERNYIQTDKRAVKHLKRIVTRMLSRNSNKDRISNYERVTFDVNGREARMAVPYGWNEIESINKTGSHRIIKSFCSIDSRSSIRVIQVPILNRNEREISEQWLRRSEVTKVKVKWGRSDNTDYFWTLSRDRNHNIYETYTVVKDGVAIILTGQTDKKMYRFFRSKFSSVFNSLSF